ncbi:hypothetical protein AVEN_220957-1 [Araneus ventricosus]|uniref:Uncharacterized protein n=1 Tax=Araneus ventricosus TaxID=182803 RepID=A0A4Y2H7E6_ARAVE|nr:hypothetical protein AVEN_220957-1 [Araneus ventricosus]
MVWGTISYDSKKTFVVISGTLTANLYVRLVIEPVVLLFLIAITRSVFQQNKAFRYTAAVTLRSLQIVDMLPRNARSSDISPIERV